MNFYYEPCTATFPSQNYAVYPWYERQYSWWQQYPTVYPLTFPTITTTTATDKEKSMEPSSADDAPGAIVETITDIVDKRFVKERVDLHTLVKVVVFDEIEKREEVIATSVLKKINAQLRQQVGLQKQ